MSLLDTLRFSLTGLVVGVLALGGCSEAGDSHEHDGDAEHAEVDEHAGHDHSDDGDMASDSEGRTDVYVGVLGELKFVPEAGDTQRHPKIRHMQIPDFKKQDGAVAMTPDGIPGMKSMTMEFPLAEGVSIEGFEAGDKVRFSFRVFWGEKFGFEITEIEQIDPGTEIDFSNVKAEP